MMNVQKGNMYGFVTHTWNTIKGKCHHNCSYCYMKVFTQKELRLDNNEFNIDLGKDNFIFVGSSTDMFASNVPEEWILKTLEYCNKFDNQYLFQTKNPKRFHEFLDVFPPGSILCVTIESNRTHSEMNNSPSLFDRFNEFKNLEWCDDSKMITIEPIMDFEPSVLIDWIRAINPFQVNIGADSKNHKLDEPSKEKVENLIKELETFTVVFKKDNLKRLLK